MNLKKSSAIVSTNYFDDLKEKGFDYNIYQHYCNAPMTIELDEKHQIIGTGLSDDIDLFQDDKYLYLLSRNYNLDYIGLEVFEIESMNQCGHVFIQDDGGLEALGEILSIPANDVLREYPEKLIDALDEYIG